MILECFLGSSRPHFSFQLLCRASTFSCFEKKVDLSRVVIGSHVECHAVRRLMSFCIDLLFCLLANASMFSSYAGAATLDESGPSLQPHLGVQG